MGLNTHFLPRSEAPALERTCLRSSASSTCDPPCAATTGKLELPRQVRSQAGAWERGKEAAHRLRMRHKIGTPRHATGELHFEIRAPHFDVADSHFEIPTAHLEVRAIQSTAGDLYLEIASANLSLETFTLQFASLDLPLARITLPAVTLTFGLAPEPPFGTMENEQPLGLEIQSPPPSFQSSSFGTHVSSKLCFINVRSAMRSHHREAGASRTSALPSWSLGARERSGAAAPDAASNRHAAAHDRRIALRNPRSPL
jgi:hypothetical protein